MTSAIRNDLLLLMIFVQDTPYPGHSPLIRNPSARVQIYNCSVPTKFLPHDHEFRPKFPPK